jgi:hypothetical protein
LVGAGFSLHYINGIKAPWPMMKAKYVYLLEHPRTATPPAPASPVLNSNQVNSVPHNLGLRK